MSASELDFASAKTAIDSASDTKSTLRLQRDMTRVAATATSRTELLAGLIDVISRQSSPLAAFFLERGADGKLALLPPQRVFWSEGASVFNSNGLPQNKESGLLRLNDGVFGRGGRRTFCVVDWDGDGVMDIMLNSAPNVNFFRGLGRDAQGRWRLKDEGPLSGHVLAGHATKPTATDFDKDGVPDLLIGAEDGFFYQVKNPRAKK